MPSSSSRVLDTPPVAKPPPIKRQRKMKDADAPAPEKRGAIFKKKCPKNILERLDRVASQRFFMVDRQREGNELHEEFSVLGSTGNVYTVIIDKTPTCNCPDATKGNHCKHILFIFSKVLQVPYESSYWYQKALITSELEDIFANAPRSPTDIANAHVLDAYARATGKAPSGTAEQQGSKKRVPGPEDDCPICYENMHGAAETTLTFCDTCGNGLHTECFQQWAVTARQKGQQVSCVFCRAKWVTSGPAAAAGASRSSEGYINLGSVAGLSHVRDTSSYYHGPRKGKRHNGYQDYDNYY